MRWLTSQIKLIKIVFVVSVIILIVAYCLKDRLPPKSDILPEIYQEPVQTKTDRMPFEVKRKDITYTITPLYEYTLYGLVVTYHHSVAWFDYYHNRWKDYINVKDVATIWGSNIKSEVYQWMKFWSGSFTCYGKFKGGAPRSTWNQFDPAALSNNHVLSDNAAINKLIMNTQKGDQIYLKGYLVKYAHSNGAFKRETSTIRTDNLCEVIYVTEYDIMKKANKPWRVFYALSKYIVFVCLLLMGVDFVLSPIVANKQKMVIVEAGNKTMNTHEEHT